MTLWNKEQDDGSGKPNWLSEDEKARCYCDDRGWVLVHLNGTEEVLVAGGGLNNSNAPADATQKTAAETAKAESLSDDDGDGIPQYQDPDDDDE
jgi:hypothetical protein